VKSFPITWLLVFLATFFFSGGLAALVLTPVFSAPFGTYMRSAEDMSGMGIMVGGFVIMSLAITMLFSKMDPGTPSMTRGIQAGLWVACLVVADYMIVVGWSTMPAQPMILSGIISAVAPFAGGVVAGLYNKSASNS